jgi:competence protein ComEA
MASSKKDKKFSDIKGFENLELGENKSKNGIEKIIEENKLSFIFAIIGIILIGVGLLIYKGSTVDSSRVEIIDSNTADDEAGSNLVVEIAGAIEKPGVYELLGGSRIDDLLIASGGLSAAADRDWVDKMINRAAYLTDGQKIYIPKQTGDESANNVEGIKVYQGVEGSGYQDLVNINTSSQKELESLSGIGPVYAQNIIEHRPYSNVEELLSKEVLKSHVYESIKNDISVY